MEKWKTPLLDKPENPRPSKNYIDACLIKYPWLLQFFYHGTPQLFPETFWDCWQLGVFVFCDARMVQHTDGNWVMLLENHTDHPSSNPHHHHHHPVPELLEHRYPQLYALIQTKIVQKKPGHFPLLFCISSSKFHELNQAVHHLDEKVMCQEAWKRHLRRLDFWDIPAEKERERIAYVIETVVPEFLETCIDEKDQSLIKEMQGIAVGVQKHMVQLLGPRSWLDARDVAFAKSKIESIDIFVGTRPHVSPKVQLLQSLIQKTVHFSPQKVDFDALGAYMQLQRVQTAVKFFSLNSHDRGWSLTFLSKSAGYDVARNEIFAPLGMLYDLELDTKNDMERLASFGTIIGHELFHAIDTLGMMFDESGKRLFSSSPHPLFVQHLIRPVIDYFSGFHASQIFGTQHEPTGSIRKREPEIYVDGAKTCDENLADIAGLQCVYSLVAQLMPEKRYKLEFFKAYMASWARHVPFDRRILEKKFSKSHAPEPFRVMGSLATIPEFFTLFQDVPFAKPRTPIEIFL
jgi:hypothetical protein